MTGVEESSELLHGSNSSISTKQGAQKSWIENVFYKRECICFIPSQKDKNRCGCGRLLLDHYYLETARFTKAEDLEKWSVQKHTDISKRTDAHGTIEFQGGPHPTKAQYVRLSYDTRPELILQLLQKQWKLELPKLLISVHGGIANFDLQPKLKRVFRKGLHRAAKTTGAWIVTGGTDSGVMRHVGDALGDTSVQARNSIVTIGMAPWGIVHHRTDLIGSDITVPYHAISSPKSNDVALNSNHSYFLLVDNGTVGKYGGEIILRKKLEKFISQQKLTTRSGSKSYQTPVVCLVLEGGTNTIRTVLECVTDNPPVPIVVCDGSGRAADLLAFTLKYAQEDGTMPETLRDQLILTIEKTFQYSREQAEKVFIELMLCVKKKDLITVFRMGEGNQDIDLAILTALLKGQNSSAADQLSLALAWNRVDIARSHIFVYGQEWPEGSLEQAMMDALVNDRVEFVQLLIENGVNMKKFLTIPRLEELYNIKQEPSSFLRMLVKDRKKNFTPGYRYTLYDIGQVIEHLMSGAYRSSYCRRKFRSIYNTIMKKSPSQGHHISNIVAELPLPIDVTGQDVFDYPFHDLMVWAILLKRQKMARFMWQHGEEPLAKALIATKLYRSMAHEAAQDDLEVDVSEELKGYAGEFSNLAIELLDYCYKTDDDLTEELLTYELDTWSKQTCLSLAVAAVHREFLAHTCCQLLLTDLWMGGLRMRKYTTLKVILGIILPPTILMLEFKTKEELEMMPQTLEEHIQELMESDSEESLSDVEDKTQEKIKRPSIMVEDLTQNGQVLMIDPRTNKKSKSLSLGKKFYEFYNAPITRFWAHTLGYIMFLMMYTYVVLIKMREIPSWQECYVIAYIFTLMAEKFREIFASEPVKFSQKLIVHFTEMWNVWDGMAILLFIPGMIIRFIPGYLLDGRVFYCVDIIFWYVRIMDIMSVNKYLGPYVMMIGKMVKDMVYFIVILLIVMMSFGVARQAIRNPNEEPHWQLVRDIYMEPYFMIYGEVYAGDIDPPCGGTKMIDGELPRECVPGKWVVPAIMAVYLIVANILLINLLIAVFNNTFHRVNAISTQVWKFLRYSLVIEFEDKPILPPPLIVVSHFYLIVKYIYRKCHGRTSIFDNGLKLFLDGEKVEKLHDFEEECVEDYFRNKEQEFQSSTAEKIRTTSERVENMALRIDDMNQKENAIKLSLQTVDYRLAKLEEITLQTAETLHCIQNYMTEHKPAVESLSDSSTSTRQSPPFTESIESEAEPVLLSQRRRSRRRSSSRRNMNEKRLWPFTDYSQQWKRPPFTRAITVAAPGSLGHEMPNMLAAIQLQANSISQTSTIALPKMVTSRVKSPPKNNPAYLGSALYHRRRSRALSKLRGQHIAGDSSGDDEIQKGKSKVGTPRSATRVTFSDNISLKNLPQHIEPTHTSYTDVAHNPALYTTATKAYPASTTASVASKTASPPIDIPAPNNNRFGINPPQTLPEKSQNYATVPVTPIITPSRSDYTTITDEIDTSAVNYEHSPPGSPSTPKLLHFPVNLDMYTKKKFPNIAALRTESEQLKNAEESEHEQMESMIRRRIRQISLTESDSMVDIAKHVMYNMEMDEHIEKAEPAYHSDDAEYDSRERLELQNGLMKVKSEPWLPAANISDSDLEADVTLTEKTKDRHPRIKRQRNNSEPPSLPISPTADPKTESLTADTKC